jgi:hypothetical protein
MEPLQYLAGHTTHAGAEAFSALPLASVQDAPAPVVRVPRTRRLLAAALHRAADAIAPPRGAYAGARNG